MRIAALDEGFRVFQEEKKIAGRISEPKCAAVSHLASRISVTEFDDTSSFLEGIDSTRLLRPYQFSKPFLDTELVMCSVWF